MRDLWNLGKVLAPDGALLAIYPSPDKVELAAATKKHKKSLQTAIKEGGTPSMLRLAELAVATRDAEEAAAALGTPSTTASADDAGDHVPVNEAEPVDRVPVNAAEAALELVNLTIDSPQDDVEEALLADAESDDDEVEAPVVELEREFFLHDDVIVEYGGEWVPAIIREKRVNEDGITEYDVNFVTPQWGLRDDGTAGSRYADEANGLPWQHVRAAEGRRRRRPSTRSRW